MVSVITEKMRRIFLIQIVMAFMIWQVIHDRTGTFTKNFFLAVRPQETNADQLCKEQACNPSYASWGRALVDV